MKITFKVELSNRLLRGRAVGNNYLVVRYVDGCRANTIAQWCNDAEGARGQAAHLNAREAQKARKAASS
jgi:hypothetical protein